MQILKEDVKQKIIDMGKKRFKKYGYENTSMKDIATDAGISTGNIYRYFLTKKHLLNEILMEIEVEIEDFFNQIPSDYKEIKLGNLFELIISFTTKIAKEKNDTLKILFQSQNESQFISFKENLLELFTKKMIQILNSIKIDNEEYISVCEAVARAQFEGFTYIVKNNLDDINLMKKNLEIYQKLMIEDLGLKVIETIKKERNL